MHALVKVFLRLLSFLLPPSWLQAGSCWWAGPEHLHDSPRLKRVKPLTDGARLLPPTPPPPSPPLLPPPTPPPPLLPPSPGSLAAAAAATAAAAAAATAASSSPAGSAWRGIRELWQAVRLALVPRVRASSEPPPLKLPPPPVALELPLTLPTTSSPASMMSAVETELEPGDMGTRVTITVAIQAAEDEEPDEEESLDYCSGRGELPGGSCSEDDMARHEKSSGAGTSGGELEEESWQPPDPELTQKLVAQIEYYLSDENLEHDAFLLKHVRRNKLGFVSVKLLTSFKKVKHLTRDWRTTAYALRQSNLLELNDEGRKVRRRTSVPVFASESLPSRMLLLSELQRWPELGMALAGGGGAGDGSPGGGVAQQERLMELLLKAFGVYGPIASVRVLKPGKDLPADLKKLSGRYSQLGSEECAIVEFEEVEAAVRAHEAYLDGNGDGKGLLGLKMVLIGTKPPKKKVQKERSPREEGIGGMRKSRSLNSRVRELQYHDDSACSSSETESNPTSPRLARKSRSSCNKLSPTSGGPANFHLSPRSSPWNSPRASPSAQRKATPQSGKSPLASEGRLSPEPGRRWADYSSDSSLTPSGSPWVQRRKQVASQESSPVGSPMLGRKIQNADGLPPGVVRLPRGPDGTRGFHERGKAAATQT
uniref:La ribonucleoprotein 6, translational regulator a n=1 Tax=Astyanax mexicanus TaxID=7994 RepID=A0A3B1J7G6_ASTMX